MAKKTSTTHIEQDLSALEAIVKQLESAELTLEEAVDQFEKGMRLAANCQQTLTQTEQRIQTIMTQYTAKSDEEAH